VSGVLGRLYRGETNYDFFKHRTWWYIGSAALVVLCLLITLIRGFSFGIEFQGGTQFQFPAPASVQPAQVEEAVNAAGVETAGAPQVVGSGSTRQFVVKTQELSLEQQRDVREALADDFGVAPDEVSVSEVSSSWGGEITRKALTGLVVFLVAVCLFLAIRFEWEMAVGSIVSLVQNLVATAGIYALIGFEVSPSTIVGLLTILGFSLYDNVVVFDKVEENARGILGGSRMTYSEAANLAINQTLMRTINTSIIALLPVAGLLFVGAGVLGVGTIKDLALVLFIGLASGAYSSLFLATPLLADLKERKPQYAALRRRVAARRAAGKPTVPARAPAGRAAAGADEAAEAEEAGEEAEAATVGSQRAAAGAAPASGPRPGARPKRPQQRRGGGRPSAKRRR
jgi:preprotein translocase subunit SecF